MLSFGTTTPVINRNGVHGPSSSPVQGQEQQHGRHVDESSTPRPPPLNLDSTTITPAGEDGNYHLSYETNDIASTTDQRREQQTATLPPIDSGSPVKQQSPLRQSISYDDYSGPESPALSFRGSIDFANTIIGRSSMSYTGDKKHMRRVSMDRVLTRQKGQADQAQLDSMQSTPTRQIKSQVSGQPGTPNSASPTGSSRFAFFSSSISALKGVTSSPPVSVPRDDELMNMDIQGALFPAGGHNGETFSPAAYKNLQMTATGLLYKFQTAYQQRTIAYHELKAERGAQAEEKDEAETRMHHLKMQLEDMARRAAEQEATMQSLMEELNQEKRMRMEERQFREKGALVSAGSSLSEDLGVEEDQLQRRSWRRSAETVKSDIGCETDEESIEEASVFSRSRSPTTAASINTEISSLEHTTITTPTTTSPTTTTTTSPTTTTTTPTPVPQAKTPTLGSPRTPRPSQPQMNALQKLFKGISGDTPPREATGPGSCRNCEGQATSVAWDTVNLLKDENKGLKERVGELEGALDGALDVVNGVAVREIRRL